MSEFSSLNGYIVKDATARAIAKGRNQAVSFESYAEMVEALNGYTNEEFTRGQNIYIGTVGVPDLWVYSVESIAHTHEYTTDEDLVAMLEENTTVQCGYYKLAQLEGQKVDLTEVVTDAELEQTYENMQEMYMPTSRIATKLKLKKQNGDVKEVALEHKHGSDDITTQKITFNTGFVDNYVPNTGGASNTTVTQQLADTAGAINTVIGKVMAVDKKVKTFTATQSTGTSGNLVTQFYATDATILGVSINGHIAIPFVSNNAWFLKVLDYTTMSAVANKEVTYTLTYIEN